MLGVERAILVLAVAYLVALVTANLGCAPTYYLRADVQAIFLVIGIVITLLLWATAGDTAERRVVGMAASGAFAGLLLQPDVTLVAVPMAAAGCLRLPAKRRWALVAAGLVFLGIIFGHGLPLLAQQLMSADQFRCP